MSAQDFLCKAHDRSPRVFRKKCRLLLRVRMFSQKNVSSRRESSSFRENMEASELSLHVFGKKCGLAPRVGVFSEKNADWRRESACFRTDLPPAFEVK